MNLYAAYKGDDFLAIGTLKELADRLSARKETIIYYATPAHRKRVLESKNPNGRVIVIRVEGDDEE